MWSSAIRLTTDPPFPGRALPVWNHPKGHHDISFRTRLMTVPLALLTIGGLLLAAGGAQAVSPTH